MLGIAGACFNILVAGGIPLASLIYFIVKKREYLKFFLFGVLGFFISQIVLRLPLLTLVQGTSFYQEANLFYPVLVVFLLSLSAALFEEPARYLFLRMARKIPFDTKIPIAYGLGHGGLEALLMVGISYAVMIVTQFDFLSNQDGLVFWAGFERISAMIGHIALSVVVYAAVCTQKKRYLLLAIALHTLFNFSIVLDLTGLPIGLLEIIIFGEALVLVYIAKQCIRKVMWQ